MEILDLTKNNCDSLCTIDLRNLDVNKIKKNKFMKPRKNPIHRNFVDHIDNVFLKFNLNNSCYHDEGSYNKIYKNENFVLRVSKKIFHNDECEYNYDKHLNIISKKKDEELMIKAVKNDISPQVYFLGNILINNNIHRYAILESYMMNLADFFKNHEFVNIQEKYNYYNNYLDIFDDITSQLINIFNKINKLNIVYYDIKPENIVLNIKNNGEIVIKLIDWDRDYCREVTWIKNNEMHEAIIFLNLLILAYYVRVKFKKRFLQKKLKDMFNELLIKDIMFIILDLNTKYIDILCHYFFEKDNFESYEEKKKYMTNGINRMIISCT